MDGEFRIYQTNQTAALGRVDWEGTLTFSAPPTDYAFYSMYLQIWNPLYDLYISSTCVLRYLASDGHRVDETNIYNFETCGKESFIDLTSGNYNK